MAALSFPHDMAPPPPPAAAPREQSGAPLAQQSSRGQSRFVEGSMNDRVSYAPPPSFLGADELAAYERQFYAVAERPALIDLGSGTNNNNNYNKPRARNSAPQMPPPPMPPPPPQRRPMSSAGHQPTVQTKRSGFFGPLWDNVRHLLPRSRSSTGLFGANASGNKDKENRAPQQKDEEENPTPPAADKPKVDTSLYPSRDEVLESYKSLVASGFFNKHAIQSTRHAPPPGCVAAPLRPADGNAVPRAPTYEPPPIPTHAARSFAQRKAEAEKHALPRQHPNHHNHHQDQPSASPAIPYSTTRVPANSELPSSVLPRRSTESRPSTESFFRHHHKTSSNSRAIPSATSLCLPPTSSPGRGTKRTAKSAALGAEPDHESEGANTSLGGARKLVKRLRKSTSRLGAELVNPSASRASFSRPSTAATSASMPSYSLFPHSIFAGHSAGRDATSTFFPSANTTADAAPTARDEAPAEQLQRMPTKLAKARLDGAPTNANTSSWRARRRDAAAGRPAGRNTGSSSSGGADTTTMETSSFAARQAREKDRNSIRSIEPPQQQQQQHRMRHSAGEAGVPEPVSVVPDAERGIPSVPRIPSVFFGGSGEGGGGGSRQAWGASLKGRSQHQHVADGGDAMFFGGSSSGQQHKTPYGNRDSGLGEDVGDACDETW